MFSFHRYMVEHHNSSEDEAPTKRPIKGATRLRQLLKLEKLMVKKYLSILTSTLV